MEPMTEIITITTLEEYEAYMQTIKDNPSLTQVDDWSPGDVIYAYEDGTIVLDDGVTTFNKVRAQQWIEAEGVCFNCSQWRRLHCCEYCS